MKQPIVTKMTILFLMIVVLLCGVSVAEESDAVVRPIDVDGGYIVEAYEDYLYSAGIEYPYVQLLDLDLDGLPELVIIEEWGRWYDGGRIVKISPASEDPSSLYTQEHFDEELFPCSIKLALCADKNGDCAWYAEDFNAGTGLSRTTVSTLMLTEDLDPVIEEWFASGNEELFDEETGEIYYEKTGYYVHGEEVDYDTYRLEEIKRRQMKVLFSSDEWYEFPQRWQDAVNTYSVLNLNR